MNIMGTGRGRRWIRWSFEKEISPIWDPTDPLNCPFSSNILHACKNSLIYTKIERRRLLEQLENEKFQKYD